MYMILKTVALPFLIAIAFIVAMIVAANAQDVYRPIAMTKGDKGDGGSFFCITQDMIKSFAGFFGLKSGNLAVEALMIGNADGPLVLVEFKNGCAVKAQRIEQ